MRNLLSVIGFVICLCFAPIEIQYKEVEANVSKPLSETLIEMNIEPDKHVIINERKFYWDGGRLLDREKEIECLSYNIYFEAAVESTAGKLAVAHVTHNRMKSKHFPGSYCEVVYQGKHHKNGHPKRNLCQFSWYCDGKHDSPYPGPTWAKVQDIAEYFYHNVDELKDITDGATYYHADYIPDPRWAKYKSKTVKIDTHIFYR